jgi:hypothetical protein
MKAPVKKKKRWPSPKFDENVQPHFLFMITPPYSGSTAISKILNTSHRSMTLAPNGEGHWLIPGLYEKDRWNSDKEIPYESVKATWLSKYQEVQGLTHNIDVVIEKSPPNMMRMEQLSSQFNDCSFIANNRDPYAICASMLYRHRNTDSFTAEERISMLSALAKNWLIRSTKIKELTASLNAPLLTYENFCNNPSSIKNILNLPSGVAESITPDAVITVKDYKPQPISNQNERQISKLTNQEIEHISGILKSNEQLLDFFGYQLLH